MNQTETLTLRQRYSQLSEGKKRLLIRKYTHLFGACKATFFNKLQNETRLRPIENIFFTENLI